MTTHIHGTQGWHFPSWASKTFLQKWKCSRKVNLLLWLVNMLNWIFVVLAHWNNSLLVDMSLHSTHYLDSEPDSLCSYSSMLCTLGRRSKNQFYSSKFDPTKDQTHNLPHLTMLTIIPLMPLKLAYNIYNINKCVTLA